MKYKLGYSTNELIDMFIENIDVKDSSKKVYKYNILMFVKFLSKKRDCIQYGLDNIFEPVRRKHIIDYKKYLIYNKTSATADSYLTGVRVFFHFLYDINIIDDDYSAGVKSPYRAKVYSKFPLDKNQVKQLLLTCNTKTIKGKRDYAIIMLMAVNGLRRSEVLNLRYGDLTTRNIDGEQLNGIEILGKGQNDKQFAKLADQTYDALEDYLVNLDIQNDKQHIFIGHGNNNKHFLLCANYLSMMIKGKLKEIGLVGKNYSCHSLRHTAGTLLLDQTSDLNEVKNLLRHKSIATTQIYTSTLEDKRRMVNKGATLLGNFIFN